MKKLIEKSETYVMNLLKNKLDTGYYYHNINHTLNVVRNIKIISKGEAISKIDTEVLILAGYFHDVGYTVSMDNHEEIGAKIAREFLEKENVEEDIIRKVENLIIATNISHTPGNILEKIIVDADSWHLGSKNYEEVSVLLRKEWEATGVKTFTEEEWVNENINFTNNFHCFHTNYAQENWQNRKEKNIAQLFEKLDQIKVKNDKINLKKIQNQKPEKGIETMLRITIPNHISLSSIADSKANILLSVNAIILSLVISSLIPRLDSKSNEHLLIPTLVLIIVNLGTIILAIQATRPNVTSGKFTRQDILNKKVNLLFFGNFHKSDLNEYLWAMNEMMQDKKYLYDSMIKDLYFLGVVLHRKYKILRMTYTFFTIGIILSVILFILSFFFMNSHL